MAPFLEGYGHVFVFKDCGETFFKKIKKATCGSLVFFNISD